MKKIVENATKNVTAYNAIVNNVRVVGNKKFASIDLSLLEYDEMYQRGDMINSSILNKLIANFDANKMDCIRVVEHPETATFAIVDGIHRAYAVQRLKGNDTSIEAEIISCDIHSENVRREFEASLFVKQNENVEKLSAIQKHSAGILLGDEADILVENLCNKYHINAKETNARRVKAGIIGGFSMALNIARTNPEALSNTFEIIYRSGWIYEQSAFKGSTLNAFKNLFKYHPENTKEIMLYMPSILRQYSPMAYEAKAIAAYPIRANGVATALLLEDDLLSKVNTEATYKLEAIKRHPELA